LAAIIRSPLIMIAPSCKGDLGLKIVKTNLKERAASIISPLLIYSVSFRLFSITMSAPILRKEREEIASIRGIYT